MRALFLDVVLLFCLEVFLRAQAFGWLSSVRLRGLAPRAAV